VYHFRPPFTLQRLCELIVAPEKWGYTTTKRYVYAVEKVLTVTSFQDTLSPEQYSLALQTQYENMRIVKERRKPGEEDPVEDEDINNRQADSSSPAEVLTPHEDTPALTEGLMFVGEPGGSSAMDVDN
jgi:hypothetical protein